MFINKFVIVYTMSSNNADLNKLYAQFGMENPDELEVLENLFSVDVDLSELGSKNCSSCKLETRINICCKRHPETNEFVTKKFSFGSMDVCPNFGENGLCSIYDSRPLACENYNCEKSQSELNSKQEFDYIALNTSALYNLD